MNDFDFIDRKHNSVCGEIFAYLAIGAQNSILGKNKPYVSKDKQSDYLYELEKIELENEFDKLEMSIRDDLKEEQSNYNSRLKYSLESNFVELDLCCENITWNEILWDGETPCILTIQNQTNNKTNFSLYDIYLKIEKTNGEFNRTDILDFINFKIKFKIGGSSIIEKDFFTMCVFELIDKQEILIETNILYFKAFTFENMQYGMPIKFLNYHAVQIESTGLNKELHSNYKIDVIFSGKNLSNININPEHLDNKLFEQIIIQSQITNQESKINSGTKIKFEFNHPVSILMFFLYNDSNLYNGNKYNNDICEDFEFTNPEINSIGISLNGYYIWWDNQELIKIDFMGIILSIVCIDPQLKDYNKFCSFTKNNFNPSILKSINFSRIDSMDAILEYDSDKKFSVYFNGLNINLLRMMYGMAGIAWAN
jgi:hypothetical protein